MLQQEKLLQEQNKEKYEALKSIMQKEPSFRSADEEEMLESTIKQTKFFQEQE